MLYSACSKLYDCVWWGVLGRAVQSMISLENLVVLLRAGKYSKVTRIVG